MKAIDIEGYSVDEILELPDEVLDGIALSGEPLVLRAGSAEILGEFRICSDRYSRRGECVLQDG